MPLPDRTKVTASNHSCPVRLDISTKLWHCWNVIISMLRQLGGIWMHGLLFEKIRSGHK